MKSNWSSYALLASGLWRERSSALLVRTGSSRRSPQVSGRCQMPNGHLVFDTAMGRRWEHFTDGTDGGGWDEYPPPWETKKSPRN